MYYLIQYSRCKNTGYIKRAGEVFQYNHPLPILMPVRLPFLLLVATARKSKEFTEAHCNECVYKNRHNTTYLKDRLTISWLIAKDSIKWPSEEGTNTVDKINKCRS